MRVQGSFGSAGSSRSLRRTATAVGVGQTATVMALRSPRRSPPARLDEPSVEEIRGAIRTQQCCWCKDSRTFRALSQHLTRGHGIDLQEIRDRLGLRKRTSFISEATRELYSARGRFYYDPESLKATSGPHRLSAYGIEANRAKLEKMWGHQGAHGSIAQSQRLAASHANAEKHRKTNLCSICGKPFQRKRAMQVTVCSKQCNEIRRKRRAPTSQPLQWRWKSCASCGKQFHGHRLTCSLECRYANNSAQARARSEHWNKVRALARAWARAQPLRVCETKGCGKRYLAKGLCNMHYQRIRALARKETTNV